MKKFLLLMLLGVTGMSNLSADVNDAGNPPEEVEASDIYKYVVSQNTPDILSSLTIAIAPNSVVNGSMMNAMRWADGTINQDVLPYLTLDDEKYTSCEITRENDRYPGSITISFSPVVYKTPGNYTLTIPAGFISWEEDGKTLCNPDLTEDIEIKGAVTVTVDQFFSRPIPAFNGFTVNPENKADVESISTIVFDRGYNGTPTLLLDKSLKSTLTCPGNTVLESTDYSVDTYGFNVTFPEQTTPGKYTLNIPAGVFASKILGENSSIDAMALNPEMSFTYTIGGGDPEPSAPDMYINVVTLNTTDILSSASVIFAPESLTGGSMSTAMRWSDGKLNPEVLPYLTLGEESITASAVAVNEQYPGTLVIEFNPPVYKNAGTYTLTLPEGLISWVENDETLANGDETVKIEVGGVKDITLEEFFSDPYPEYGMKGFTISPADKETVESIISVALNKGANSGNIVMVDAGKAAVLTLPDGKKLESTDFSIDTYSFNIHFPEQTSPGTYTLDIPEGIFGTKILGEKGSFNASALNPAMTFTYNIEGDEPEPSGPEMYSKIVTLNTTDILSSVSIIFAPESIAGGSMTTAMRWDGGTLNPDVIPYLTLGEEEFTASEVAVHENYAGAIVVSFNPPIYETAGTYTLTLPAGLISWEEEGETHESSEVNLDVEIAGVVELTFEEFFSSPGFGLAGFSVDPGNDTTVESFSGIILNKGYNSGNIIMIDSSKESVLTLPDGSTMVSTDYTITPYNFNILFPEQLAVGDYTLEVPAGIFGTRILGENNSINASALNPAMKFTYKVSNEVGVDTLPADPAFKADVYDLTGRCINRGATSADLKKLEKGTYLIGKRKIQIR